MQTWVDFFHNCFLVQCCKKDNLRNLLKPQATLNVWSYWILLNWRLFPFDKRNTVTANKHCSLLSWKLPYCMSSWCLSIYEEIYGNLSCIIFNIDTWDSHMKYILVIFLYSEVKWFAWANRRESASSGAASF